MLEIFPGFNPNWTLEKFMEIYRLRYSHSVWSENDVMLVGEYFSRNSSVLVSAFFCDDEIQFQVYTFDVPRCDFVVCRNVTIICGTGSCDCSNDVIPELVKELSLFTEESHLFIVPRSYKELESDILENATRVEDMSFIKGLFE